MDKKKKRENTLFRRKNVGNGDNGNTNDYGKDKRERNNVPEFFENFPVVNNRKNFLELGSVIENLWLFENNCWSHETLCLKLESEKWYYRSNYFAELRQKNRKTVKNLDTVRVLKHPVTERQHWGSNGIFILVCVCVAVTNAGTGPMSAYISQQATGPACLVLFFMVVILSAVLTVPMIILELALGQVFQGSQVKVFDGLCYRSRGFALTACLVPVFQAIAECLFGATAIMYLISSVSHNLPWDPTDSDIKICLNPAYKTKDSCEAMSFCRWSSSACVLEPLAKPLEYFRKVWQINPSNGFSTTVILANAGFWFIVCLMLGLGIHVVANIAPFVAILPNIWFLVVTFMLWINNSSSSSVANYFGNDENNDWSFIQNISFSSLLQINEISMRTLPTAGMGMLLTLASYNHFSGNVHVVAWSIFISVWILIFAAFHFLYANAGELMSEYGIKSIPHGLGIINWMIGNIRNVWLRNPLFPGYYVFSDPSFSTLPITFPAIPAKSVWCMLYYLWAVCALVMYLWAKMLPMLTAIIDSRALYNSYVKGENTLVNNLLDDTERVKMYICSNNFEKSSIEKKEVNQTGRDGIDLDEAAQEEKEKNRFPFFFAKNKMTKLTVGKIRTHRFSRFVVSLIICVPVFLMSLIYCVRPTSESPYDGAQYVTYMGSIVGHVVHAFFAVIASWCEGAQEQMKYVGYFPVLLLGTCWIFCSIILGVLHVTELKHSVNMFLICFIVGGTIVSLLLCNRSIIIESPKGNSYEELEDFMSGCRMTTASTDRYSEIQQKLSLSERAWWLLLGNIELFRVGLNTIITTDAHVPIPFYWSILLKFWTAPMLLVTASSRSTDALLKFFISAKSYYSEAHYAISAGMIICWLFLIICIFICILGIFLPQSFNFCLTKERLVIPKLWYAVKKERKFTFFNEIIPTSLS